MKARERDKVYLHSLLIPGLDGGKWLTSRPARFTLETKENGIRWTGGWMAISYALDMLETRKHFALTGIRTPPVQPVP